MQSTRKGQLQRGHQRISEPFEMDGEMVVRVQLTRGMEALLNAEDVPLLEGRCWQASDQGYACTVIFSRGPMGERQQKRVLMHHLLLKPEPPLVVDHINRNPRDNRRKNLRVVTKAENARNSDRVDQAVAKRQAREALRRRPATLTGADLRELRLKANLTLRDLARTLGVDYSTLSLWENGRRQFSLQQQQAFIAALGSSDRGRRRAYEPVPAQCRLCDRKGWARGLCSRCYQRERSRAHKSWAHFTRGFVPH